MWSVNRVLLVCGLLCTQSLLACGGSSVDAHGNPPEGEEAGDSSVGGRSGNEDDASGGKGPHSSGAPAAGSNAAGSPATDHGSAGAANPGPDGTKLSEIETDAQALAVCERIRESISE